MPIRISGMQKVMVKRTLGDRIISDVEPHFEEEGAEMMAAIQPVSSEMKQTLYGEEKSEVRLMLTRDSARLKAGYGVCVEREDGVCDFRIAEPVEHWGTHQRAVLKRIAEDTDGI